MSIAPVTTSQTIGRTRFAVDDDLTRICPRLDEYYPRRDAAQNVIRSWDPEHVLAMEELERRLRNHRDTPDVFEIGRLGQRSRVALKPVAAYLALYYIFDHLDDQGDGNSFFARRKAEYWRRAGEIFTAETLALDYDFDNDGTVTAREEQRPFISWIIRG